MTSDAAPIVSDREEIARFWLDIAEKNASIGIATAREKVEAFNDVVQRYWPDLALEIFEKQDSPRQGMCITAHGASQYFPLVMNLMSQASLSEYEVETFRKRSPKGSFSMEMDGFTLNTSDVLVGCFKDGPQVGFEIRFGKEIPSDFRDHASNMSFIMLDHVIGEYEFAIKTGAVQFVDDWSDAVTHKTPLNELPSLFDHYWSEELGHTGAFPLECKWKSRELTFRNERDSALLTLNDSVGTLAMRADMTYALELIVPVQRKEELTKVQDTQDRIAHVLEQPQSGILVYTMQRSGRRHALYYVNDEETAVAMVQQQMRELEFELHCKRDFKWSGYYRFAR